MKKSILFLLYIVLNNGAILFAQQLSSETNIAEINIVLDQDAQNKIAAEYTKLSSNPSYLASVLPKMQLYFPTIERVLEEEGLPDDFKYLAVMESGLIAEATGTNSGVGFWLFKKEQAIESELRIDAVVDERKHLIASTKALCLSLKRNNLILNNWALTLLSHNLGLSSVRRQANSEWTAKKDIKLNGKTDPYILTFLAYKSYLEPEYFKVKENRSLFLYEYVGIRGKSFYEIAKELSVEVKEIQKNNVWLQSTSIPDDKEYVIYLPVNAAKLDELSKQRSKEIFSEKAIDFSVDLGFPVLKKQSLLVAPNEPDFYEINGKNGIKAIIGDTPESISQRANVQVVKFLKYNDLIGNEKIIPNEIYYLAKKDKSAVVPYHTVLGFETLWKVSQMYGIILDELKKKNRISGTQRLVKGRRLWLFSTRPENESIEVLTDISNKKNLAGIDSSFASTDTVQYSKISIMGRPMEVIEKNKTASDIYLKEEPVVESPVKKARKPIFVYETPDAIVQQTNETSKESRSNTSSSNNKHIALPKETLFSIAKKYSIPLAELYSLNNLESNYKLQVGDILKIKESKEIEVSQVAKQEVAKSENSGTQEDEFLNKRVNKISKILYENDNSPTETPEQLANATSHTVLQNETFFSISKKYAITMSELYELNKLGQYDKIKVGQILKIRPVPEVYASLDNAPGNTNMSNSSSAIKNTESIKSESENKTIEAVENKKSDVKKMLLHKILPNETLETISKKYNVNSNEIFALNSLDIDTKLSIGQILKIKDSSTLPTESIATATPKEVVKPVLEKNEKVEAIAEVIEKSASLSHIVKSKETLFSIAKKYKVGVNEIISSNKIKNNSISLGQKLSIPTRENKVKLDINIAQTEKSSKPSAGQTHTVRKGESTFRIAKIYGIKLEELVKLNKIKGNKISVGQKLIVKK